MKIEKEAPKWLIRKLASSQLIRVPYQIAHTHTHLLSGEGEGGILLLRQTIIDRYNGMHYVTASVAWLTHWLASWLIQGIQAG